MDTCSLLIDQKMLCCGTYLVSQNVQPGELESVKCCVPVNSNIDYQRFREVAAMFSLFLFN